MTHKKREDLNGGIILVGIGLLFLIGRFINFGGLVEFLILPGLGAIFLLAGILKREAGLMIPGGILSGIGLGIVLSAGPFELLPGVEDGGLFLMSMGLGFISITFFSALFGKETHWWALIPGGILGFIGLAVSLGGVFITLLELVGTYWPLILVGVGVYTIYKAVKSPALKEKSPEDLLV
ncbi:MAG: hypothetical protein AAF490_27875 [Chloroflexota bacterium]